MSNSPEYWVDTAEEDYDNRNLKAATAAALIAISKILSNLVDDIFDDDLMDEDDDGPWGKRAKD